MSIQQEILDTIGADGVEITALRGSLGNMGSIELDIAVRALMRAQRIRVAHNRYEVIPSTRPLGGMPHTGRPPSAEEEAAASLDPGIQSCTQCNLPKVRSEFRLITGGGRSSECNACHGKRTQAGLTKRRGQPAMASDVKFHSAQRETVNAVHGQAVSHAIREESADVGSIPAAQPFNGSGGEEHGGDTSGSRHSSPAAAHPFDGSPFANDPIFTRVTLRKRAVLNRIALLEVEMENLSSEVGDCERFLELFERFARGAG